MLNKSRGLNTILGFALNLFVLFLTVIAALKIGTFAYDYTHKIAYGSTDLKGSREVRVTIPKGASTKTIGEILYHSNLITSVEIFRLNSKVENRDGTFKSGTFSLNTSMNEAEIVEILQNAPDSTDEIKFVIPEGLTLAEIAKKLEKEGIVKASDFMQTANTEEFDYAFLGGIPTRNKRLEGYLFPDTYYVRKNSTSEEIISKMLNRFNNIYSETYLNKTKELGLSMDQVVIMASIIEKEVRIPSERAKVASIINNRLLKEMNLQMCSTIIYSLDKKKDKLLVTDTKTPSPYNTYMNPGLPVGPICNPSEASIHAVLYPANTNYLYFVLKEEETGEHYFTDNYDDFLVAKQKYKQKF